jgi:hypothetical protein
MRLELACFNLADKNPELAELDAFCEAELVPPPTTPTPIETGTLALTAV